MAKERKKDKEKEKVKKAAKIAPVEAPAKIAKPVKAAAPKKKKAITPVPAISNDDIALRAYFIAEKRHATGAHGDSHSDWVEAERQLRAEARKAKKA